jgi:hypothetical protein
MHLDMQNVAPRYMCKRLLTAQEQDRGQHRRGTVKDPMQALTICHIPAPKGGREFQTEIWASNSLMKVFFHHMRTKYILFSMC